MELKLKIKISENLYVYGKLSGNNQMPLIIIVHGLPGSMDEDFYIQAARWFELQGYATFRFNLYGFEKNARQLIYSTLETQSSDLDSIVSYFQKKKFSKIFLIGHSFGGLNILLSKKQHFDGATLWDPSYQISFTKADSDSLPSIYIKQINAYLLMWGANFVLGKKMVEQVESLQWPMLTKNFTVPLKIIVAGQGALIKGGKSYYQNANEPKVLEVVTNATHYFNDEADTRIKLFTATHEWFKDYM